MDLLIGQTLGHYKTSRLLGQGEMGAVYQAHDVSQTQGPDAAIKVIHDNLARHAPFRELFSQVVHAASQLDHPGIAKVSEPESTSPLLYVVIEYIPGNALRYELDTLLARQSWMSLLDALRLTQQVSLALDYAHHHGVIHGGIKPENIILRADPSAGLPYAPVLTDFGLARLLEGDLLPRMDKPIGAPTYMSPEQALGQPLDARSDIYSLGVLLFFLAVGQLPFRINTLAEAVRFHVREIPPSPRSIRPDLPTSVEDIILRALKKDPNDRFASMAKLTQALDGALQEMSASAALPVTVLEDAGPERAGLSLEPTELTATPGQPALVSATIANHSQVVDHFKVEVKGIPDHWVQDLPAPVYLEPGYQQQVSLTILPPKAPQTKADFYPLTIAVASQVAPDATTEMLLPLTVAPYRELSSELWPANLQRRQPVAQVSVTNKGNAPQTLVVRARDPADELKFDPLEAKLTVEAGQTETTTLRVARRRHHWFGPSETYPFVVQVSSQVGEISRDHQGQFTSRPYGGGWLLAAMSAFVCLSLTAALMLAESFFAFPLQAAPGEAASPPAAMQSPPFEVILSRQVILEGDCVELRWAGEGVTIVSLEGMAAAISQPYQLCPAATTTYTLKGARSADDPNPSVVTKTVTVIPLQTRTLDFVTFPNGKPVIPVYVLKGDEFEALGVRFAVDKVPQGAGSASKSASPVISRAKCKCFVYFLTTQTAANGKPAPLSITFLEATRVVTFTSLGPPPNTYQIFDGEGKDLSEVEVSKGASTLSFRSIDRDIGRVVFTPKEVALTINRIEYRFIPKP